ncbi:hypothetical protein [Ilumatobacter sp.]|uniref:hypothetical protein n=1 Tax=Ilumatobacter sp. TaxID=1967498 RepID=UPI003C38C4E9
MNPDNPDDIELRGIAMGAVHEHEASVTAAETESALASVRSRIASGDVGAASPGIVQQPRRRSPWVLFGAAAAVVAMIGAGLVTVLDRGSDGTDVIVPASEPSVVDPLPETTLPETTLPETTVPDPTTTTIAPDGLPARQTISVDAANPPELLEPVPYASVPLEPNPDGNRIEFAVGADHVVVNQPDTNTITIVGPGVSGIENRTVPVDEDLSAIVSGPGPVVYGLGAPAFEDGESGVPSGLRFVAIPFLGEREGQVVAVEEVPLNAYLELPPYFFGHGPDGVIARGRNTNETVIGYVDENGEPRGSGESTENGTPFPLLDVDQRVDGSNRDIVSVVGSDLSWELDITRDPEWESSYTGPDVVVPGSDGRVLYAERIGANTTPDQDFGENSMPVVAVLDPDGSGRWVRLPDDWDVVASDVWGTLLARITDDAVDLALLDDLLPPVSDPDTITANETSGSSTTIEPSSEPSDRTTAIARDCVSEFDCTQLANTEDGRIVVYDPADQMLQIFDATGTDLRGEIPIDSDVVPLERALFVAVGPDDVAYLRTMTPGASDPSNDLLAIPLVGDRAGQVVERWTGLDGSGDSTLVPRRAGLTVVNCCGELGTRPEPDAVIYRWVDRDGDTVESNAPSFDLNLGREGNSLTRIDGESTFTRFALPTVFQYPRDFPPTVATTDGGALSRDFVQTASGGVQVIVEFGPDWPDNGDVYFQPIGDAASIQLLEPTGTVIVADGDTFVRRELDEVATPGWPGRFETDRDGATSAPGLNEYIDENQPFWAADPELFALQLKSLVGPNESVLIEYDQTDAPDISITTFGFLDDSVAASQRVISTARGDDGLLRFVSGTYTFQCQPGRGHQDFSAELCN